jgi:mRNA interferase MazF
MPIQAGEFWVADIPFTNGSGSKKRPVLVLWLDGLDAVVAAVTSAARARLPTSPWPTGGPPVCASPQRLACRASTAWNRRCSSTNSV